MELVGWDGNEEEYKRYLDKTFKETKVPVEIKEDDGPIVEPSFKAWWGVPDMPKVNFENKQARKWALDVTKYWIENFDIDGWRMDVAKELDFSFWKDFRDIAYGTKEDVLLISEIFGDTSQWLQGDRFDGTMNYSFRETMTDYFATDAYNEPIYTNPVLPSSGQENELLYFIVFSIIGFISMWVLEKKFIGLNKEI